MRRILRGTSSGQVLATGFVLAISAGITVALIWLNMLRSPFNQAVYDRIPIGMTVEGSKNNPG